MACCKAVVSTALPTGVPWVNRHMETGLVVPPGDHQALASAMQILASDSGLRGRLGAGGLARVAAEFTADRMAMRAIEVYRDACRDPQTAPVTVDGNQASARADVA